MSKHLKYLSYVIRHKWFVFLACLKLRVPLNLAIWHDASKFAPSEWFPYVNYFYGDNRGEGLKAIGTWGLAELAPFGFYAKDKFDIAWNHHQKCNKHHWQYWLLTNDEEGQYPLPMPEKYAREMVADWNGAGRALGKPDTRAWYEANKDKIILRLETREMVNDLLDKLSTERLP